MTTILVTGFWPFPGAPYNPTQALVGKLARLRRPALAGITIVPHVFPTSYAAVDRELPKLIATHRPDALLMFGLAARTRFLRIETRARNALALLPDVSRARPRGRTIATGEPGCWGCHRRRGGCSARSALPACLLCSRPTPVITCAITCAGRQSLRRVRDHGSRPSSTCPSSAASRCRAAKIAVSRRTI